MRRWNSWGDSSINVELPESAKEFLTERLGSSQPLADAGLEEVLSKVPQSRLPLHPLIDSSAEVRLHYGSGQSFPNWLEMRSGQFPHVTDGVAFPESSEQVAELLQWAKTNDVIVVPYGGGTSVVGHLDIGRQSKPVLTIAMTRMNLLIDFDEESLIATFGAGANGPEVEAQLGALGYTLGHFPQSFELSTLGGWVVTRSSGQQSLRYGRIEKMFVGGRMETLDGPLSLIPFPASSAGPDFKELVLGSEGRIGILTEVKVQVQPLPEHEKFITYFLPDWATALSAVKTLAQRNVPLSMLRLSNPTETDTSLRLAVEENKLSKLNFLFRLKGLGDQKTMLTVGYTGAADQIRYAQRQVTSILSMFKAKRVLSKLFGNKWEEGRFKGPYLREPLWKAGYAVDTFETALNWSNLGGYCEEVDQKISEALSYIGVRVLSFSHLSHVYPQGSSVYTTYVFPCAPTYEETLDRWKVIKELASKTVVEHIGTISHQHGVGRDHAPYLEDEKGSRALNALDAILEHFDDGQRLNPGSLTPSLNKTCETA
ncbi:FAD-binding oxidoreductase [Flexibacterium corallicola]|uniref:FAD-binding oxidoreductase n=1 Tax=Flexibacterium corallicola TaxID=3037259 RepID=UPI00286EC78C|nr:FAD-binding oxidoreductase [Pseudovibrio sp. M1P-2-3]